ncbi:uncharacterized protein LOC111896268 isoform X1 [Lactuca sativa]|uniref:uncharacterized protein LOC111896268 isoform X1 n=1 Tax=Lactuca sativa TaxID=4236 RepID=UPI000CD9DB28|nr:uncharacterized protein LOC111896268 isoform X1 [Lactuca sativa]
MISIFLKMNQQNISKTPDLPVKRKRGRPRKDESMPRPHPQPPPLLPPVAPAPPPPTFPTTIQPPPPTTVLPPVDHNMVGQAVTCIIDGIFDNGYLLSTRLGPNNSILRGIVFQQGHVAPVTPENDVAPHLEMCTRTEFPIPPANPRNPVQFCAPDQSVCVKQAGETVQNYQNTPQPENLRLVEQDDVMQVFEVSKAAPEEVPKDCENEDVGCDPTAETESFPEKESMIPGDVSGMESEQHGNQDIEKKDEGELRVKEPDELVTPVGAITENQPLLGKDELQEESEVNNNIDATQAVAVDLSLSNFSEI